MERGGGEEDRYRGRGAGGAFTGAGGEGGVAAHGGVAAAGRAPVAAERAAVVRGEVGRPLGASFPPIASGDAASSARPLPSGLRSKLFPSL